MSNNTERGLGDLGIVLGEDPITDSEISRTAKRDPVRAMELYEAQQTELNSGYDLN